MTSVVQPHAWVGLKLPSESVRFMQIVPNTMISLGQYGSFPSNLIIERPFYLTYELEDRREDEGFSRLRVIPAAELHADALADGAEEEADKAGTMAVAAAAMEIGLESQAVIVRSNARAQGTDEAGAGAGVGAGGASTPQTLTTAEIEALKREGTDAGRGLIAQLLRSHGALDQKTAFSLAKYKLLKTKKYLRRFTVVPLDVPRLGRWLLDDRDAGGKILELRDEMVALLGCWANVHYGGEDRFVDEGRALELSGGRWLVVDDTGGFLVAAMAERMGILYEESVETAEAAAAAGAGAPAEGTATTPTARRPPRDDLQVPVSLTNTLTLVHANTQPNLTYLKYFGYDHADPTAVTAHPLGTHLLCLSWLQLLDPASDSVYNEPPTEQPADVLATWKPARRGHYHRKRRRWARTRHTADTARTGGFAGLVVATGLDLVSTLRHALPLLAGGAPVAVYAPSLEPLARLADCFSVARRAAWSGCGGPPTEMRGQNASAELERWPGSAAFPLNPMLLLGVTLQTSRARRWQVLPGRTHPLMTARGGAEGYVLTGYKAKPAEGRVTARGKFHKRRVDTQVN